MRPISPAARLAAALALLIAAAAAATAQPSPAPGAGDPAVVGSDPAAEARDGAASEAEAEAAADPNPDAPLSTAAAEGEGEREFVEALFREWEARAGAAENALASRAASTPAFEVLREVLAGHRTAARELAARTEEAVAPLRDQLEALGPPPEDDGAESEPVARERRKLSERVSALEARKRQAELARARAEALIDDIDALIRDRFADQLLSRGPSPLIPTLWLETLDASTDFAGRVLNEAAFALRDEVRSRERTNRLPLIAAAFVVSAGLTLYARRAAVTLIRRRLDPGASRARRTGAAALAALVRALVLSTGLGLFLLALRQADLAGPAGEQLIGNVAGGLAFLVAARALALAWYSPEEPQLRISGLGDEEARSAARAAFLVGSSFVLEAVLVLEGEAAGFTRRTLAVLNLVAILPGAAALWSLASRVAPPEPEAPPPDEADAPPPPSEAEEAEGAVVSRLTRFAALAMRASAVLSVALAAAGYFAASRYAFFPPAMTVGLVGLGVLIFTLINEAVEAWLESDGEGGRQELRLIPIFFGFVLICAGLPLLALIWGARPGELADAWDVVVGGFELGGVRLSPIDLFTFLLVFGIGYTLTRFLQTVLNTSVLPKTRLDTGGRTAITSGVGYVGVAVAALVAFSSAGLDLSNLAIVAGALSVGIGFGLQTIVANFVSGIILLVERPIRVGDWIETGGTHGTVKKIQVRATEIETFDRSALILPNSELISGRVTNYTRNRTALGRLIVPVGVAYGSDVRLVERILREIAQAERRVVQYPAPMVLFMGFGADSLDFELRVILRDVNNTLSVRSDLHFEIDRRFREAGIEIPFAQRVVHVEGLERLAPRAPAEGAEPAGPRAPTPQTQRAEPDGDARDDGPEDADR